MEIVKRFTLRKGLNLPITGEPTQKIHKIKAVKSVALLGRDYVGMKPTMLVKEGDTVKLGTPVFEDKKNPGVVYTAPAAGQVTAINRGAKRVFLSLVIRPKGEEQETFKKFDGETIDQADTQEVRKILIESGLWTAFRTRPFSKVPAVEAVPHSVFVSVMDTNPLAADPEIIIGENQEAFQTGLKALTLFPERKVALVRRAGSKIDVPNHPKIAGFEFEGPHPAGLVGTHIHFIDPVGEKKSVWHIGYQDVIAIGKLLTTGKIWTERVVSLAGPGVKEPRLIRTRLGACVTELTHGNLLGGENRLISGSVYAGHDAGREPENFLGRYHQQISVIRENRERVLLGWHAPGFDSFSTTNVFVSSAMPGKRFAFDTNTNGSRRAMVPIGMYENVMPLDFEPTFFLRALISKEMEDALALGALELDEEDLGLCSFVCPGKTEYGPLLREMLTTIEKEG